MDGCFIVKRMKEGGLIGKGSRGSGWRMRRQEDDGERAGRNRVPLALAGGF